MWNHVLVKAAEEEVSYLGKNQSLQQYSTYSLSMKDGAVKKIEAGQ